MDTEPGRVPNSEMPARSAAKPRRARALTPDWARCVVAIAVYQLGIVLLNSAVFPLFAGVLLEARDIGTLVSAICELGLYLIAVTRPRLLEPRRALAVALACTCTGSVFMIWGALAGSPVLLTALACVRSVGNAWMGCIACLPLVDMVMRRGTRRALAAVCAGWALGYALELCFLSAAQPVQLAAFCLVPVVVACCSWRGSSTVIGHTLAAAPASDLRVTNPRSFLPLASTMFVMLVLLKMSFGFAMTFSSVDATPINTVVACIPALFIAVTLAALSKADAGLNGFYRAAMLCVLAGFLLVNPLIGELTGAPQLANVLLRAGSDLTRMLSFLIVAYIGSRNPMNALATSLYLGVANSLGSVCGAQLGIAANAVLASNEALFALLLAGIVFAFVAYNMIAPHNFDFDKTARSIQTVAQPQAPEKAADAFARAVETLARERGLTPRESEALDLLARGRNTQAIQERMVVSRSTAKTHVRNVYAKLDVHSQQELIDLVEQGGG